MKQFIIIINPATLDVLSDVVRATKNNQEIPSGVIELSDSSFLIDVHKSLPFLSSLVHNAHKRNVEFFVFSVDDTIHASSGRLNSGQEVI